MGAHVGGEGGCLPERCRAPQSGRTPLHLAAEGGRAAVIKQLLAAGAAVDAKDMVRGELDADRGGLGGQNAALRVLSFFLLCASQNLGVRSLPGLVRGLVT